MESNLADGVAKKLSRHVPTILTVVSTIGVVATAYLFARAGMKAERKVQHEVRTNEEYVDRYPTYTEMAEYTWMEYVIPTSVGIATIVCLISANVLNMKSQATLMGAYALGERTWAKYRENVLEMIGLDNEKLIRAETVKDVASDTPVPSKLYGEGDTVYLDVFSGQMFRSDEKTIYEAMTLTNEVAEENGFVSLNFFYDRIGARTTQIGELMGWSDGIPLEVMLTPVQFEDGSNGYGLDYVRYPFWGYHEV
jgi:hypothetical protein